MDFKRKCVVEWVILSSWKWNHAVASLRWPRLLEPCCWSFSTAKKRIPVTPWMMLGSRVSLLGKLLRQIMANLPAGHLLHSYWTWPIELVDLPILKWWFSIAMSVYQRVNHHQSPLITTNHIIHHVYPLLITKSWFSIASEMKWWFP